MRLKLLVSNLKNQNLPESKIIEIDKSFCVIGRKLADVVLEEPRCSKQHAVFYQGPDGGLHIRDMGSTNGTFVNGTKVIDSPLARGTEIRIGKCYLSVLEFESVQKTGVKAVVNPSVPVDTASGHETEAHQSMKPNPPKLPKNASVKRVTESGFSPNLIHFVDEEGTENQIDFKDLIRDLGGSGPTVGPRKGSRPTRR